MPEIKLTKRFKYSGDVFAALMKKGWSCTEASDFVNSFRDADCEEVVRCKDCKHWMYEYDDVGLCVTDVPDIDGVQRLADDFCSYGKRRTK